MSRESKTVREYPRELRKSSKDKPQQVRESLQIYVEMWQKAIEARVVSENDGIDEALAKLGSNGGLYQSTSVRPKG